MKQLLVHLLLPLDHSASWTVRICGGALILTLSAAGLARWKRRRRLTRTALAASLIVAVGWLALYSTRPAWLRYALEQPDRAPQLSPLEWTVRGPGLETADSELSVDGRRVEQLSLIRLDPAQYRLSVHWDPSESRTVEQWQEALGAQVVINGSYFTPDGVPQTPIRAGGAWAGPTGYVSQHGALVADERGVRIIELDGKEVAAQIAGYPEAMVSYPLLVDSRGQTRAQGADDWLASRTFVALDRRGRLLLGITRGGYFSLRRLGQLLLRPELDVAVALNLDGGPLASQLVKIGDFERVIIGSAEINHGADALRALVQAHRTAHWRLPIVLSARHR